MIQQKPREAALQIWNAAVDSVRADRLLKSHISVSSEHLSINSSVIPLADFDRLIIVGAGKAATAMARGLLQALPDDFLSQKQVTGWINVPENCVESIPPLTVHPARPVGLNEPTPAAVAGTEQILALTREAGPRDICVCLISGGGSALLTCPIPGITLAEKVQLIRLLSESGANIQQLNTVRKELSRVKGGELARQFNGLRMITLIVSDVIGDPLDIIASGPTVEKQSDARQALTILKKFDPDQSLVSKSIYAALKARLAQPQTSFPATIENHLIGNLQVAVDAAEEEARRLGFEVRTSVAQQLEGSAEEVGRTLTRDLLDFRRAAEKPVCIISGGEPIVQLVPAESRGKGGRNQQLVLAALTELTGQSDQESTCILSGGTDGEDGPTDAAGALVDDSVLKLVNEKGLDPNHFLKRNDAYHFFAETDGLFKTGATHTNVCDVRVAIKY